MIFVTIGTQEPFDRFLKIIDSLIPLVKEEVVVQAFTHSYKPKNFSPLGFVSPDRFEKLFAQARIIVAHAGMGTIISALESDKPIVIFPRIASLGEHRNEHQMATARRLDEMGYAYVAYDEERLRDLLLNTDLHPLHHLGRKPSADLIGSIKEFIG